MTNFVPKILNIDEKTPIFFNFIVLGSDLEEIWSRADGGRKREVPKVDMALVSIDDS